MSNVNGRDLQLWEIVHRQQVVDVSPDDLVGIRLELVSLHDLMVYLQSGKVTTLYAAVAIALGPNALTHCLGGQIQRWA